MTGPAVLTIRFEVVESSHQVVEHLVTFRGLLYTVIDLLCDFEADINEH